VSTVLPSWPRPHFVPGGGGAFLLYAVYGSIDLGRPLDGTTYRVAAVPPGVPVESRESDARPDGFAHFLTGPLWETVRKGATTLPARVEAADDCVLLRGTVTDPPTLDYLRDAVGVVTWALDNGGVAVFDVLQLKLWSADEWRAGFSPPAGRCPGGTWSS
jgi:hypothetical protein